MRYLSFHEISELVNKQSVIIDFNPYIFSGLKADQILKTDSKCRDRFFNQDSTKIKADNSVNIFNLHLFFTFFQFTIFPYNSKIIKFIKNFINNYCIIKGKTFISNEIISVSVLERFETTNESLFIRIRLTKEISDLGFKIISPLEISLKDFAENNHEVLVVNLSKRNHFIENETKFFNISFFWRR